MQIPVLNEVAEHCVTRTELIEPGVRHRLLGPRRIMHLLQHAVVVEQRELLQCARIAECACCGGCSVAVQLRVGGARAVCPLDDERDVTGRILQAEQLRHVRPVDGHHEAVIDIAGCDLERGDLVEELDADPLRRVA
jgi:hypothetical protein